MCLVTRFWESRGPLVTRGLSGTYRHTPLRQKNEKQLAHLSLDTTTVPQRVSNAQEGGRQVSTQYTLWRTYKK